MCSYSVQTNVASNDGGYPWRRLLTNAITIASIARGVFPPWQVASRPRPICMATKQLSKLAKSRVPARRHFDFNVACPRLSSGGVSTHAALLEALAQRYWGVYSEMRLVCRQKLTVGLGWFLVRKPGVFTIIVATTERNNMATQTLSAHAQQTLCSLRSEVILIACCMCNRIRDEIEGSRNSERWVTQVLYRQMHDINPANCLLSHTYCPRCFTKFMARVA